MSQKALLIEPYREPGSVIININNINHINYYYDNYNIFIHLTSCYSKSKCLLWKMTITLQSLCSCDISIIYLSHPALLIDQSQRRGSLQDSDTLKSVSWWQPQLMLQSHSGIQCWSVILFRRSLIPNNQQYLISHCSYGFVNVKKIFLGGKEISLIDNWSYLLSHCSPLSPHF